MSAIKRRCCRNRENDDEADDDIGRSRSSAEITIVIASVSSLLLLLLRPVAPLCGETMKKTTETNARPRHRRRNGDSICARREDRNGPSSHMAWKVELWLLRMVLFRQNSIAWAFDYCYDNDVSPSIPPSRRNIDSV